MLVGHSLGGLNIRMFAELHPDGVAGLVFVDSSWLQDGFKHRGSYSRDFQPLAALR